jgi:methionyl-tRNA formyltransferase
MPKPLSIIFMGTPDFSVGALKALIKSGHKVVCVYSQPPRPKGRGQQVQKSPVHLAAEAAGIEVRTPVNFKQQGDVEGFAALRADVAIVAAYGLILPKVILDAPRYGCINIHASLLPRWRGAAPIQRSILAGDAQSGVTIMQMETGLDTGPMIAMETVSIDKDTTAQSLHDALSDLGARMIGPVADALAESGNVQTTVQPQEGVTYAHMLKKEEGRIDWSQPAGIIDRQVRALNPWPSTYSVGQDGKRFKIVAVEMVSGKTTMPAGTIINAQGDIACGYGTILRLLTLQPESKKPMAFSDALRGQYLQVGDVL